MRAVPQDAAAPHLLGVVRAQQGRNEEALELMGAALALKPDAPEVLSNAANVLKTQGRFAEALAHYDKALAAKPDYAAALARRAMLLREMGRLDAALDSAARALALQPDAVEALNTRGMILADLGRADEALAALWPGAGAGAGFPRQLEQPRFVVENLEAP